MSYGKCFFWFGVRYYFSRFDIERCSIVRISGFGFRLGVYTSTCGTVLAIAPTRPVDYALTLCVSVNRARTRAQSFLLVISGIIRPPSSCRNRPRCVLQIVLLYDSETSSVTR